jgi:hypothetical protein
MPSCATLNASTCRSPVSAVRWFSAFEIDSDTGDRRCDFRRRRQAKPKVPTAPTARHKQRPQPGPRPMREHRNAAVLRPLAPPTFATPPVAIVPLDKSIPGAALEVAGPLQAWNGRAYITGSGTITAGDTTAQVTLPYRGTMHVCASSTVKLAADSSAASGDVPGLAGCARSGRGGDELCGEHRTRAKCRYAAHSVFSHHDRRSQCGRCKRADGRRWRHLRG